MRFQVPQRLMLGAITLLAGLLLVVMMGSGLARAFPGPAAPLRVSQTRILTGLGVAMDGAWAHAHPWLAVTSADGTVRVWDGPEALTFRTLAPAFAEHANAVTWSPDDRFLAAGDFHGDVAIWDVVSGAIVHRLAGVSQQIQSLAWSPDGTLLAAASWDFTVRVWNPATGALLHTLTDHRDCATAVAWSPDSQWLATGGNDDAIYVYHIADWAHPRLFLGHLGPIRSLAWSPDGNELLSTSVDMTARIWDAATGQVVLILLHDSLLKDGTWGTGRYLGFIATVAENGHLYLWDARLRGVTKAPLLVQDAAQIERAAQITNGPSDSLGSVTWQGDWLATTSLTSSAIVLWRISRI
jgi:WD40 repeat protein